MLQPWRWRVGRLSGGGYRPGRLLAGAHCRWLRWLLFSVLTWAWVLPGPVVGLGLHETILALVQHLPAGPWHTWLYYGPSPVPLLWAQILRALPAAVVFLWPLVRMIPRRAIRGGAAGRREHGRRIPACRLALDVARRRGHRIGRVRALPRRSRGQHARRDARLGLVHEAALRPHALRRR